jgi:predicted RNase H-like HicB family nuclease
VKHREFNEFGNTVRHISYRLILPNQEKMKLKVVIHKAEEGGFWAEVPAIQGCVTQGESFDELLTNLYEAIEGCLSASVGCISGSVKHHIP